ncbi:ATP-binding protein [Oceanicella actignis]|uniref:ATP-binding protein n=1 Tax=Oceanicella actignis TaxID=1189325 RepID=UPI0012545205|nr:ATP-binding protein [Oceanicella actignis]TYO88866.1 signal transduction histidine kinase [Oceanicella actignis]
MLDFDEQNADIRVLEELHENAAARFLATTIVGLVVFKVAGPIVLLAWSLGVIINEAIEILVYQRACVRREPPERWRHMMEANFLWGGLAFGAASVIIWLNGGVYDQIYAFILLIGSLLHTIIFFSHSRRLLLMMGAAPALYLAAMPAIIVYRDWERMSLFDAAPMVLGVTMFLFYFIVASLENSRSVTRLYAALREAKTARRQAEEANRTKSLFLANTSHEIRTPLNGVLGMAQALARTELSALQREQVEAIIASASALNTILNDILDVSKIEAGRMELSPTPTDVRDMLTKTAIVWKALANQKGLAFELVISPDLPPRLLVDANRLRQCVGNLVSNALKFTSEGGVAVHVTSTPAEDGRHELRIVVDDTGIGVNPEQIGAIFQPFVQADASIGRRFGGTGLGLAVTREIARMMDGDVSAAPRPGGGSRFTLTLKAAAVEPEADAPAAARAALPRAMRILVVDDTPTNRLLARMLLNGDKRVIDEAANGREALDALAKGPYDLVLLDIHMPEMDGIETIRRLRASPPPVRDVPVIALTADPAERETYLRLGMNGHVAKPVDRAALIAEIARVTQGGAGHAPQAGLGAA